MRSVIRDLVRIGRTELKQYNQLTSWIINNVKNKGEKDNDSKREY